MSGYDDAEHTERNFHGPYTPRHGIPTVEKYREEKEARKAEAFDERNAAGEDRLDSAAAGGLARDTTPGKASGGDESQHVFHLKRYFVSHVAA